MVFLADWTDPANDAERIKWLRDYQQALSPYSEPGGYINFMQDDDYDWIRDSYSKNYDCLVQVKRAYDPTNLFHINQKHRAVSRGTLPRETRRGAARFISAPQTRGSSMSVCIS